VRRQGISERGAIAALPVAAGATWGLGCGGSSSSSPLPPPDPQNPQEALQLLVEGNQRWVDQKPLVRSTAEAPPLGARAPRRHARAPRLDVDGVRGGRRSVVVLCVNPETGEPG
jgi:hypothetical protein